MRALRFAGRQIAPALSVSWMRRHFSDDSAAPDAIYWQTEDRSYRARAHVPTPRIDVDDLSLDRRVYFMEQRGDAVIAALLDDLIEALESGPGP